MTDLGSWAWAQRTHGELSRRDQAEMLRQGMLARLSQLPGAWRRHVVPDAPRLTLPSAPDTSLAREAEERVRELSSPALYGHCLRTWSFAALFAERDRVDHDEELLYVACVLHDLGLTDAHNGRDQTARCFAVEGARAARALVRAHGAAEQRALTVGEAIALHLNVDVHARYGPIATLLSKGVMLDVVGRGIGQLPMDVAREVAAAWPRDGSGPQLVSDTKRQAETRPHSRAAALHRLGFAKLVFANPLDRSDATQP